MKQIGTYAGIPISLDWRDGQQVIIFSIPCDLIGTSSWYAVHGLGNALGGDASTPVRSHRISNGDVQIEIAHTDEIDQRIMNLIDLMITMRYDHPAMVQLSLRLDPTEAHKLEAVLS